MRVSIDIPRISFEDEETRDLKFPGRMPAVFDDEPFSLCERLHVTGVSYWDACYSPMATVITRYGYEAVHTASFGWFVWKADHLEIFENASTEVLF